MQLLFSAREIKATLVKYMCKTFITLTPALFLQLNNSSFIEVWMDAFTHNYNFVPPLSNIKVDFIADNFI